MSKILVLCSVLALASCTTAQQDKIAELCDRAMPLASLTVMLPVVGPYISSGVTIACTVKLPDLRKDPNFPVWLAEQIGLLRAALGR